MVAFARLPKRFSRSATQPACVAVLSDEQAVSCVTLSLHVGVSRGTRDFLFCLCTLFFAAIICPIDFEGVHIPVIIVAHGTVKFL